MQRELSLSIRGRSVLVRPVEPAAIIDLRHRVLRAGLPRSEAIFAGDDLPESHHFAAVCDGSVIGCASFHLNRWQDQPAHQLRGMATDPAWVGCGVGTAVLRFGIDTIRARSPVHRFWCNARLIAVPFYQKMGWQIASELFEIPTAGPHHRMVLGELSPACPDTTAPRSR
jgi:GNAT superfamily N-acetyltransferase